MTKNRVGKTARDDLSTFEQLLNFLGRGGEYQYYWAKQNGDSGRTHTFWFPSGRIPQPPVGWDNTYFGVHPTNVAGTVNKRAKNETIAAVNCLYGDFDVKHGHTLKAIQILTPPPSVIISTGGGWHCYWLLKEPQILVNGNFEAMARLQQNWVARIGSDPNARDLARILRVPGTTNGKEEYNPARSVEFVKCDFKLLYNLEDFGGGENPKPPPAKPSPPKQDLADELILASALSMLNALKVERASNYEAWLNVGMSLFSLGRPGLDMWDSWSQKSDKFVPGVCARKWATFTPAIAGGHKITLASLQYWAEKDKQVPFLRKAKKGAKPLDYSNALKALGWNFSLNDMNDRIYVGGLLISEVRMEVIEYQLRNFGYRSEKDTQVAISNDAAEHHFHPVKDYLNGLSWDGVDHIQKLGTYFKDQDNLFPLHIRKWLIGAVERVLGKRPGQQHPMLVLDGKQWLGKSRFVSWLGSPLVQFYIQSAINTNDKDFYLLLCGKFVWEVEELGSTFRKSDLESLKAFLSKETINVRAPYGKYEITKPATASFIGTINNSGGFLADPTGNRRFRVCTLTEINWDYDKNVDVNQVWAQAVALFHGGETWTLEPEQQAKMQEINKRYELDDPLEFALYEDFDINPENKEDFLSTAQIINHLYIVNKVHGGTDNQLTQRISNILTRAGLVRVQKRVNPGGKPVRGWVGISLIEKYGKVNKAKYTSMTENE